MTENTTKKPRGSLKVTPDLANAIVVSAKQQRTTVNDLIQKSWSAYVHGTPGGHLGPKNGTKKLQQKTKQVGNISDISSDLSEVERFYLTKCLGLLRSVFRESFYKMIDAMCGPLGLLDERPRYQVAAGADIDRKLDEAEALAEDALRRAREELRRDDPDAGGIEGGDRGGRKKPA